MTEPTPTTAAAITAGEPAAFAALEVAPECIDIAAIVEIAVRAAVEAAAPVLLADHERQIREKVAREIEAHPFSVQISPSSASLVNDPEAVANQVAHLIRDLRDRYAAIARGSQPADNGATS